MKPTISMNRYISIILAWLIAWLEDCSVKITLLINSQSYVNHLVCGIYSYSSDHFHDLLVFRNNHVLSKVVLSAKLSKIVIGQAYVIEIGSPNSYGIIVLGLEVSFVGAVNR